MPTARDHFAAGRLNEAIEALGAELRIHPTDTQRRTFLFELLCFAGLWDRADKQLDLLAGDVQSKRMGALQYRASIAAERTRHEMFETGKLPAPLETGRPITGTLNGKPFLSLTDADARIGPRLEVFAGSDYLWVPFEHIATLTMEEPKRLRDLLWKPAKLETGPGFQGAELGDVLLPALSPFSWRHADDAVRLGRLTVWETDEAGNEIPFGLKMLAVDGEEVALLEVRSLVIQQAQEAH